MARPLRGTGKPNRCAPMHNPAAGKKLPLTAGYIHAVKSCVHHWKRSIIRPFVFAGEGIMKGGPKGSNLVWEASGKAVKCFARHDMLCKQAAKYRGPVATGDSCEFCAYHLYFGTACSNYTWGWFFREPTLTNAMRHLKALQLLGEASIEDPAGYYRLVNERIDDVKRSCVFQLAESPSADWNLDRLMTDIWEGGESNG